MPQCHHKLLALLVLGCLSALITCSPLRMTGFQSLINRANRVLQTTRTFNQTSDVIEFCDTYGIDRSNFDSDYSKRREHRDDIKNRFKNVFPNARAKADGNDSNMFSRTVWEKTAAWFCLLIAILLLFAVILLCCNSVYEYTYDKEPFPVRPNSFETDSNFKITCLFLTFLLGIVIIVLTIVFETYLSKTVSRSAEVRCAAALLMSHTLKGVNFNQGGYFIGVDNIISILDTMTTTVGQLGSLQSDATAIQNAGLSSASDIMKSSYTSWNNGYASGTYSYKGSTTPSTSVKLYDAQKIDDHRNQDIQQEVNTLASVATGLDKAASSFLSLQSEGANNQSNATRITDQLKNDLKTKLQEGFDELFKKEDYVSRVRTASIVLIVLTAIFFIAVTIGMLVIVSVTSFSRTGANTIRFFRIPIFICLALQYVLAILVMAYAIVGLFGSAYTFFACTSIDGMITTKDWLITNLPNQHAKYPIYNAGINTCIYQGGDGRFINSLGVASGSINTTSDIVSGMSTYAQYRANLSQTGPYWGDNIINGINNRIGYDVIQRDNPSTEDITQAVSKFNAYGCQQDILSLKVCDASFQASASTDNANAAIGSKYCIRYPNARTNYNGRYGSGTCTSGITYADATTQLNNALASSQDYLAKLNNLKTNFNTFYSNEKILFDKIVGVKTNADRILNQFSGSSDTSISTGDIYQSNCQFMQKDVANLESALCFRFGENIYTGTIIAIVLACLIMLWGWGMYYFFRIIAGPKPVPVELSTAVAVYTDGANLQTESPVITPQYHRESPNPLPAAFAPGTKTEIPGLQPAYSTAQYSTQNNNIAISQVPYQPIYSTTNNQLAGAIQTIPIQGSRVYSGNPIDPLQVLDHSVAIQPPRISTSIIADPNPYMEQPGRTSVPRNYGISQESNAPVPKTTVVRTYTNTYPGQTRYSTN